MGHPQNAGVNVVFLRRGLDDVVPFRRRVQGANVVAEEPLEFGFGVRLNSTHHFRRFRDIVGDFVVLVQNDGFI